MLFSSFTFLGWFLPILILIYFVVRKFTKNIFYQNLVLCFFSFLFYSWGEPLYILLMILSIVVNYYIAILIDKKVNNKKYLILAIIFNILSIGFFKYFGFFVENLNVIFKLNLNNPNIPLPIGISFYTFQIMSYVIDVFRKRVKAQRNIITLSTYVALFPQLIAGPIVRYKDVETELENRTINYDDVIAGIKRFVLGLAKKVIIANNVALVCDTIYSSDSLSNNTIFLWIAIIAYTLQIYFDFSGYSDMAIGLGKIFGFHFLENFNYPYIAKNITDFWNRWHMSLSSWFKDYLYIPLGGNRVSKLKFIRNIFIVWFLTGLWHGASWNFVLWGLYYALFLLLEKTLLKNILEKIPNFIKHIYTLLIVIFGWLIFRIENMNDLFKYFLRMFNYKNENFLELILENTNLIISFVYMIIGIILSTQLMKKFNEKLNKYTWWKYVSIFLSYLLLGICVVYLLSSTYNPFIYFRF